MYVCGAYHLMALPVTYIAFRSVGTGRPPAALKRLFWFVVLLLVTAGEFAAFVEMVRDQPVMDLGPAITVVVPTILFWGAGGLAVLMLLWILVMDLMTYRGVIMWMAVLLLSNIMMLCFVLAYGSCAGGVLAAVGCFMNLVKIAFIPSGKVKTN